MPIAINTGNSAEMPEAPIEIIEKPTESVAEPAGLSKAELTDPNKIIVTVSDHQSPIVILYGPPSCGKTMTLVRLTRYLVSKGYRVVPERTFRPSSDENYQDICDNFDQMINSSEAATSTARISFMLVKVLRHDGRPICQILEAPGEYYYNPKKPTEPYPAYVNQIINSNNRKIWSIMVEPDWSDSVPRANYVTRIANLKMQMTHRDKVLFVYNKIDLTPYVIGPGLANTKEAIRNIQSLYPNIFVPFLNQNPITKFFTKYNCDFVPVSTGTYAPTNDGKLTYTECHELYVKNLWNSMLKMIGG